MHPITTRTLMPTYIDDTQNHQWGRDDSYDIHGVGPPSLKWDVFEE